MIAPDLNCWYKFKGAQTDIPAHPDGDLQPNGQNPIPPDDDADDHSELAMPAQRQRPDLGAAIW